MKRILSSMLIFLIVISMFGLLTPKISSDENLIFHDEETFGPRADKLLIKLYSDKEEEWNALANKEIDISDSLLSPQRYDQFTNTSLADQISVIENRGTATTLYTLDINNNNNEFLGNPPDSNYPNPVYPNPCSVLGMRKAIAYLCNKTYIVNELIKQYEFATPTYTCVPSTNPYVNPDIAPGQTREDLCYLYSRAEANASLDSSGFGTLDSEGWRIWNATGQRVALRFFIRNDTMPRHLAGDLVADELEACGIKVERIYGNPVYRNQVVMEQKNFHLYTGGWIYLDRLDFLMLWNIDWYYHPGRCNNYDGCNNTDFNTASRAAAYPSSEEEAIAAGRTGQEVFAENVLGVPLWNIIGYSAVNRRYSGTPGIPDNEDSYEGQYWEGVCPEYYSEVYGQQGADNVFTFLNMHPQGFPTGAGSMTIRYGFCQNNIASLNPIYPNGPVETRLLDLIGYESLLRRDPQNRTIIPWIAKSFHASTYENPGFGTCSKINFSLRTDVLWSDGEPLTVDDVCFSLVELPRMLQSRGFPSPYYAFYPTDSLAFKIIDPYNFEILYNNLGHWDIISAAFYWILPAHIWRPICESGDPTGFQPDPNMVATGPWRMAEFVNQDHILLTRNQRFFKREPIDCIVDIESPEAQGSVVPPGTNLEFNATITNQCYNTTADVTVQTYVDNELRNTTQVIIEGQSSTQLGSFSAGVLQKGLHEIKVICTPETPTWMSTFPKQYTMPVYVTYPEDVNLDYFMNIQDCVEVGTAFGTIVSPTGWNPKADLWPDYKIDMKDCVLVQKRAAETGWQAPQHQPGLARLVIDPNYTDFSAGTIFNVTVNLENAVDVAGYQFAVSYDKTMLDLIATYPESVYQDFLYANASFGHSPTVGEYFQSASVLLPAESVSGSRLLATIAFNATQDGNSFFNLTSTLLTDSRAQPIPHVTSGAVPQFHDVAVSDVRVSKSIIEPGDIIGVQVDVANNGNTFENFNVTAYADADTAVIGDETIIGTQTVALPGPSSTTLYFLWDTAQASPGNLTISAKAQLVLGETNTTNNIFIGSAVQVLPKIHDIAVTDIRASEDAIYVGDPMSLEVDVQNHGNVWENVNLTLYADENTTVIGDEIVIGQQTLTVDRFGSTAGTFYWDTAGVPAGNYTVTAVAAPLPGEVDLGDNNKTDGIIQLFQTLPCPDINVTCPVAITVNPSIFTYDAKLQARLIEIGNVSIVSTGFEGSLRVVGSHNGTTRLCVNQPDVDAYNFYLPQNGTVQVPLWLMFQPETHWETYDGTYTLNLTVCGTHRRQLTINGISIVVCQNGAYIVNNETATFTWNLTGGSLVYLEAEPDLPPGWTYTVDPPIGTFFETPHIVTLNITAPPDAKEGDIGRVTLKAYKNSTGAMIWQFIYFASAGQKPPTIESMEQPILTPDGSVFFATSAQDSSGIREVVLHCSVDGGPWENSTMQWVSGDTCNSTKYTEQRYFGTGSKTIQYYISAVNWLGNETTTSTQTLSVLSDIAVTELSSDRTVVFEGYDFNLNATVANQGTMPLSFANIALYANSTLMITQPTSLIQNGTSVNTNFTLHLLRGRYMVTAFAACLPDEATTSNNAHSCLITVSMVGDLTGGGHSVWDFVPDRTVDGSDLIVVAMCFGSYPGAPPPYRWNANCDITNDNAVDGADLIIIARHFGQTSP